MRPWATWTPAAKSHAGGHACDIYAPADYLDIGLFMKPAGYADELQYRIRAGQDGAGLFGKRLGGEEIAANRPNPAKRKRLAKWYEILTMRGVLRSGIGNPFLRSRRPSGKPMIFQLAGGVLQGTEPLQRHASSTWLVRVRVPRSASSLIFSSPSQSTMPARRRCSIRTTAT